MDIFRTSSYNWNWNFVFDQVIYTIKSIHEWEISERKFNRWYDLALFLSAFNIIDS